MRLEFYLGVHQPQWLAISEVPLFVSARRLRGRRTFPRASCAWALDSGGFSELSIHGAWTVGAAQYAAEVVRWADEVGKLEWAAIQDWMVEPQILAKTGLNIATHQARTIDNYLELRALLPEHPWVPVLQGWELGDYWRHADEYLRRGVDLRALPRVGVGSVCRRQHVVEVAEMLVMMARAGLRLHAFGFKKTGLLRAQEHLRSSDSMAWSFEARHSTPLPGHTHKNCANCFPYALQWRDRLLGVLQ